LALRPVPRRTGQALLRGFEGRHCEQSNEPRRGRYSPDQSFTVLGHNWAVLLTMAANSPSEPSSGGRILGRVPDGVLLPGLAVILLISGWKM
jgi:hypothetical protein